MRALGWWRPRGAQAIHTVCWSLKQLALPGAGGWGNSAAGGKTSCSHFPGRRAMSPSAARLASTWALGLHPYWDSKWGRLESPVTGSFYLPEPFLLCAPSV